MSVAGKIGLGYFVAGVIYIALSDLLLGLYHGHGLFDHIPVFTGILKGWFFIFVTSVILYFVLKMFFRRLNDQRHLLNSIVNNTNDWLWLIDSSGRLLMVNTTFSEAFETESASLIGTNPADLATSEEERTKWQGYYNRALNGEEVHVTEDVPGKKGEIMQIEFRLFPISTTKDKVEMVACFGHDITFLKNVQKEIENQNNTLKEITWMQAHVIRKPVANIQGLIDALDTDHLDNKENKQILQLIRNQSDELDAAIRQIVDRAGEVGINNA